MDNRQNEGVRAGFRPSDGAASVSAVPASIPDARPRAVFEGDYPPVTVRQAENAATDLINHFFKNKARKNGGVLIGIPARPDQDTDLLLHRFIREAERLEQAFRIRVWNEAKSRGLNDASAIREVEDTVAKAKAPPAQAIEARRAETGTGSVHESAVATTGSDAP